MRSVIQYVLGTAVMMVFGMGAAFLALDIMGIPLVVYLVAMTVILGVAAYAADHADKREVAAREVQRVKNEG